MSINQPIRQASTHMAMAILHVIESSDIRLIKSNLTYGNEFSQNDLKVVK